MMSPRRSFLGALAVLAVLLPSLHAHAVSLSGRATTEIEWFDTADEETATPVYQYLLLNADDLGVGGLNMRLYGRLAEDPSDNADPRSRLYFGYVEKKSIFAGTDVRLGRQFISTTAGASLMDGLRIDYHQPEGFSLSVFGGGDVSYYDGYDSDDTVGGIKGSLSLIPYTEVGISYLQKWEEGDLAHELAGLDITIDPSAASNIYSETQYSLLTEAITYFLLGGGYHPTTRWGVKAEYLYSLPVFSSTSIYSVFAVDEYQEVNAQATYRFSGRYQAFGKITHEIYVDDDPADVLEAGVERLKGAGISGYLTATYRNDPDGQDMRGFKAYVAKDFARTAECGVGLHVDVLERRIEEDDETTSSRIWVNASNRFSKTLSADAKVERVESDLWDQYYSGRVRLNVLF